MRRLLLIMFISLTFQLSDPNITMAYEREIKSLSSTMAENIDKAGKKTIAVVDFTDLQGNVTELGRFLAEEFSVALAGVGKGFEVVDRTHLKSILTEHKLSSTGIIDPQTAKKLGQIAGVDALITGTITPFGDSVRLSVKVLATDTAKMIGASSGDIAKTKAIEELLARGIETALPFTHTSTTSHISTTSNYAKNYQAKKVGDILVTLKNISVSKEEIRVIVDFFNQSDEILHVVEDHNHGSFPSLTDENGYSFKYFGGQQGNRTAFVNGVYLQPKSNSSFVLNFKTNDVAFKEIGSEFAVTIPFHLNSKGSNHKKVQHSSVSFTNIKAQKSK